MSITGVESLQRADTTTTELEEWKKWTLTHGHMVEMGGFVFVDPKDEDKDPKKQARKVLTFNELRRLLQDPKFKFPTITESNIQDRSKGDVLFKLIAILQTSWFIMQCIARGQQRLALTELELVTLALASLNAATFGIWWHKPLGLQEPIKIYETGAQNAEDAFDLNCFQGDQSFDLSSSGVISKGWKVVKLFASIFLLFLRKPCEDGPIHALVMLFVFTPVSLTYIIPFPIFILFPLGIILLLRIIEADPVSQEPSQGRGLLAAQTVASLQRYRYCLTSAITKWVQSWLDNIFRDSYDNEEVVRFLFGWFILLPSLFVYLFLFIIFLIPFFTLLFLVSFIFTAVFGIVTTSTIRPGASHVPSFYAPITKSDGWSRMAIFALFGVIFGGLHCVGWYFKYPTHSEQTLWRATSSAITVIPVIVALIDFLLATRLHTHDINSCEKFERTALLTLDLVMTILLFIYVPARLSLIAQALALLRDQPSTALVAVDWTKYIPHLFSQ